MLSLSEDNQTILQYLNKCLGKRIEKLMMDDVNQINLISTLMDGIDLNSLKMAGVDISQNEA